MKVNIDFRLNRRFGVVERLLLRLVLNGVSNAREIGLFLPIFSDAVLANALRRLVNYQIVSADLETGTLRLTDAMVAVIARCHEQIFDIDIPASLEDEFLGDGIEISGYDGRGVTELKTAILRVLLPNVKLDFYSKSLDFVLRRQDGGEASEWADMV